MQTPYRENSPNIRGGSGKPSRSIAILAVLLFALSGLLSGFAFGAFGHTHTKPGQTNTSPVPGHSTHQKTPTATATKTEQPVFLDPPKIIQTSTSEVADNSTSYTFSTQILNKYSVTPITATDVTCKIWLTKDNKVSDMLRANNYAILSSISAIPNPFPDEVTGGLNFTSGQQTKFCNSSGPTTWTYTVSSSVQNGSYYIVVLADWKGIHFNWSTIAIKIKNG
ncbi:MAG: hypothetical protein M3Z24_09440 [Chloroflexota bacterium]|nr:hypothetical protein [Chloroflexota bacterium]